MCSPTAGILFVFTKWTLSRFLLLESTCAVFFNIEESLNLLSTYNFEAGSLMLIESGEILILNWFWKSISSSILDSR